MSACTILAVLLAVQTTALAAGGEGYNFLEVVSERGAGVLGGHSGTLWPNPSAIPYTISNEMRNDARIPKAIAEWERKTCIRFKKRTTESKYLRFVKSNGCFSFVGVVRENTVRLATRCTQGAVIHEIGHALGLTHEQSRTDRDRYVRIDYDAIKASAHHVFAKKAKYNVGAYDYDSIMHYGRRYYAKGSKDTIVTNRAIGQRDGLSRGDVATIEFLYMNCRAPSRPSCLAAMPSDGVQVVTASRSIDVSFVGRYSSSMSAEVFSNNRRVSSDSLGDIGTVSARVAPRAGETITVKATFTAGNGRAATCSVTLRGSRSGSRPAPPSRPSPVARPSVPVVANCPPTPCERYIQHYMKYRDTRAEAAIHTAKVFPKSCGGCGSSEAPLDQKPVRCPSACDYYINYYLSLGLSRERAGQLVASRNAAQGCRGC